MGYRPLFTITPRLLALTETIAALRERILSAAVQVPWIPGLQREARIRTAHSSTAIEGNPLTLAEVRALEEGRELPARDDRAGREVLNYFAGLRFIEKNAGIKRIAHENILRLHVIIAGGDKGLGMGAQAGQRPVAPPMAPPPMPPMPPMAPPAGGPPDMAPPSMAGGPPPMMRKAGGRVYRSYKDMDAGSGSGLGRLEKMEIQKHARR